MQFQQNINCNILDHLNMMARNQNLQGQALEKFVENTRQQEFDKLFDSIPIYDWEDPEKFEPWHQHANDNLWFYIHQYTKMHRQAMGLKPGNDFDLSREVEFMKRIQNTQIANKIIKSNRFKDYTRYSLQACFARALELEGDFQVGEVVTPNYAKAQVLVTDGEDTREIVAGDTTNNAMPANKQGTASRGMYIPNVCWRCGQVGHFVRD